MSDDGKRGAGPILVAVGVIMLALTMFARVFDWTLGPILGFFEGNFFLPVILLFAGRAIMRRNRRASETWVPQAPKQPTPPRTSAPPPPRTSAPPPVVVEPLPEIQSPIPTPVTPKPAAPPRSAPRAMPSTAPTPHPAPVTKTSDEMIAEAKRRLEQKKR